MTVGIFSLILCGLSFLAGGLGALTGLGGGVVIIPILSSFFELPLHEIMGLALVISLANSIVAARTFSRAGLTHVRWGLLLETGTAFGALMGAFVSDWFSVRILAGLLGTCLLFTVASSMFKANQSPEQASLTGYPLDQIKASKTQFISSYLIMLVAGALSGLLGIGSGTFKVLALDKILKLPYKISTATSNYMVGLTAATSLGIFFAHHYVNVIWVFPTVLGAVLGSQVGAQLLLRMKVDKLRRIFYLILFLLALQMWLKALRG